MTFLGSLIGIAYGFVSGFLVGYFIALVHNWVAGPQVADTTRACVS
jgi:hypothetical protein